MLQSSYLFLMSIIVTHSLSATETYAELPDWINFPGEKWETVTPEEAGLDIEKFNAWVNTQKPKFGKAYGGQEPEKGGVVLARGGYILHTWGDPDFKYQSASLGKTFTRMVLQLAVDEGLIKSAEDLVMNYWTGEGQLEAHKILNKGHHKNLTFRHLQDMVGGFPTTNGYFWRNKKDVPLWVKYTGDPDYDNYSHIEPGKEKCYSSGGSIATAHWVSVRFCTAFRTYSTGVRSVKLIPTDQKLSHRCTSLRLNDIFAIQEKGIGMMKYLPYSMVTMFALELTRSLICSTTMEMEEVMVPMRDGVKLHTKIWKPAAEGSYPVLFTRAYWPGFGRDYERFTKAGYVYVGQSTRGHGQSEGAHGVDNRFFDDADDGYDSLTWISQQPWCDGNIAMYGKSYWAATQWLVAPLQHPNLKAIIPQNVNPDFWERGYRDHGALQLAHTARRIYDAGEKEKVEKYGWMNWYRHLPLITLDTVAGTKKNKLWRDYVSHSTYDDFWQALSTRDKYYKIRIPVYLMCGWYDNYPGATFNYFEKLKKLNATNEIRVVINPSDHLNKVVGDRDFGQDANKDEVGLAIRWLDYVIKGIDTGVRDEPPVKIFVMGINEWRFEHEWPLARTQFTKYYFHSDRAKDGWLDTEPPGDETPTQYIYDPDNPVPTLGGNHSSPEISGIMRVGTVDQSPNENRDDVLVFTSPPLQENTEVTGPILVKLYAASSARDTDFITRLIDVYPDGTAYNLTEGIIRARFRESIWEPPKLLIPGKVYEYMIELLPTNNVFLKGHRIRVHIASSNFPLWDRNLNTGHEQGMDAEMQVAEQTIYHNREHPSHILLPIIPQQ